MSVLRVLFALAACFAMPAAAAPLSAYGGLPTIETVAVSPSGHAIALSLTDGEERLIVVQDLATQKLTTRAATGRAKVRYVRWAGDRHLVIVTTVTATPFDVTTSQREWAMGFRMDLATQKVLPLLRDVERAMNTIYGAPTVRMYNGEPTVFVQGITFVNNEGRLSLFRVDMDRATSKVVEVGASDTRDWVVGVDG